MGAIAASESIDAGSRSSGGVLGDVHRGELSGPLEDAIFDAEVGAIIGPVRTEHGWHVVRVEAVSPESVVPYRDVAPGDRGRAPRGGAYAASSRPGSRSGATALAVIEPEFEHPGGSDPRVPEPQALIEAARR